MAERSSIVPRGPGVGVSESPAGGASTPSGRRNAISACPAVRAGEPLGRVVRHDPPVLDDRHAVGQPLAPPPGSAS